jgi:excisionase family DNA binding protein
MDGEQEDRSANRMSPVLLLRVEEAATRLGIARTKMYQLVRTGEVESVQVGRLRRIPVACLDEYVEDLRTRPAPA